MRNWVTEYVVLCCRLSFSYKNNIDSKENWFCIHSKKKCNHINATHFTDSCNLNILSSSIQFLKTYYTEKKWYADQQDSVINEDYLLLHQRISLHNLKLFFTQSFNVLKICACEEECQWIPINTLISTHLIFLHKCCDLMKEKE